MPVQVGAISRSLEGEGASVIKQKTIYFLLFLQVVTLLGQHPALILQPCIVNVAYFKAIANENMW